MYRNEYYEKLIEHKDEISSDVIDQLNIVKIQMRI